MQTSVASNKSDESGDDAARRAREAAAAKEAQFAADLEQWKARAKAEFPELSVAGSEFNKRFLEKHRHWKSFDATELSFPNWPYLLAHQVNATIASQRAQNATVPQVSSAASAGFSTSPASVVGRSASTAASVQSKAPANPQKLGGIVLRKDWATAMQDGDLVMGELRDLIAPHAKAAVNLEPAPDIDIYKGVTYLMPLKQALVVLGIKENVNSKKQVVCPGFPSHSLFNYSFNGRFEGGYNSLYVVTDSKDQVVAIQLGTASPKKRPSYESTEGQAFDFVNTRTKALTTAKVLHQKQKIGNDVLKIDSFLLVPPANIPEFQSNQWRSYSHYFNSVHETSLYVPRPLMELILYRARQ